MATRTVGRLRVLGCVRQALQPALAAVRVGHGAQQPPRDGARCPETDDDDGEGCTVVAEPDEPPSPSPSRLPLRLRKKTRRKKRTR